MEQLLRSRQQFENLLYDFLINVNENNETINLNEINETNNLTLINVIPEDFWEPVVVCLSTQEIENLETVTKDCECLICKESKQQFKNLKCCNNDICGECINHWFNVSVYCPFCKQDQREILI